MVFDAGLAGRLAHFRVEMDKLPACAAFVADTIRQNYPDLKVPPHSRWRHLSANGHDWAQRLGGHLEKDAYRRAAQMMDLALVSVLLDAGAGPDWKWRDPVTGRTFARSEGLALASLEAFRDGVFSSSASNLCCADAAGLQNLDQARLAAAFQVRAENPLVGLDGRVALLRRLGDVVATAHSGFGSGDTARFGNVFYQWVDALHSGAIKLPSVLEFVLETLGGIWPGRIAVDGVNLGDTWHHPAIAVDGPTRGLMPLHKLSQWLTYSLIEPMEAGTLRVTDRDGLTGLAEYRNGGLFIDGGVLVPRDPKLPSTPLTPDQEPIVEWRALTVALLDEIAPLARMELGVTAEQMPLASILEGGTWAAGRRIAAERRPGGGPPLTIISDGTVF